MKRAGRDVKNQWSHMSIPTNALLMCHLEETENIWRKWTGFRRIISRPA